VIHSKVNIGLTNPKSPANVGAVMRAAGCFDVDAVYYSGERYARAASFNTDTQSVAQRIPLRGVDELLDEVAPGMQLVCVELVEGATPLPDFVHPENAYYLFGPEDGTLGQSIIDRADAVVFIPTLGCLNLAATVNVVLYDRLAKAPSSTSDDELIRQSRDCNNRVVVKARPSRI
jgi:tRNA(Leu) C34 or U34 (ribose-2'-O)-methylase TrmL